MSDYVLHLGDCLEEMSRIEDGSVDMICADLPYGCSDCSWDIVIPFEPLWKQYKRVTKRNGAVVLFGNEPFTSLLVVSNLDLFKYKWTWDRITTTGFFNAKFEPLRVTEDICIFYDKRPTYNPILEDKLKQHIRRNNIQRKQVGTVFKKNTVFGSNEFRAIPTDKSYPRNLIRVSNNDHYTHKYCTTQKPVALLEYLIKTYTNPGELVLDNVFGSCSTGEACLRTGRRFVGIEKDENYYQIGVERMERVAAELRGEYRPNPTRGKIEDLPMFAEAVA